MPCDQIVRTIVRGKKHEHRKRLQAISTLPKGTTQTPFFSATAKTERQLRYVSSSEVTETSPKITAFIRIYIARTYRALVIRYRKKFSQLRWEASPSRSKTLIDLFYLCLATLMSFNVASAAGAIRAGKSKKFASRVESEAFCPSALKNLTEWKSSLYRRTMEL